MKNISISMFAALAVCGNLAADRVSGKPLSLEDIQAVGFKTINGESIVGSGNIEIPGSGDYKAAVNAADFGAVGDGATDDTAALAAALAEAKKSRRPLYLPKTVPGGAYLISGPLTLEGSMSLTSALGVKLRAQSGDALKVKGSGARVSNLTVESAQGAGIAVTEASNVTLLDVIVNAAASDGIALSDSTGIRLERVVVKNAASNAVRLGAGARNVHIRECLLALSPNGVYFDRNAAGAVIVNNQIDCSRYALVGTAFDKDAPDLGATIANNTFNAGGVNLTGGARLNITGNSFLHFKGDAIALQLSGSAEHPLRDSTITCNTFGSFLDSYTNPDGAIIVSGAEKLIIRGNVLRRMSDYYKAITGSGKVDIVVAGSKKVIVSGNSVEGAIDVSSGNEGVVASGNATVR